MSAPPKPSLGTPHRKSSTSHANGHCSVSVFICLLYGAFGFYLLCVVISTNMLKHWYNLSGLDYTALLKNELISIENILFHSKYSDQKFTNNQYFLAE